MGKRLGIFLIFILITYSGLSQTPQSNNQLLFLKFLSLYNKGELIPAESVLSSLLKSDNLTDEQLIGIYNNLGVLYLTLGDFEKSLTYNVKAEGIIIKNVGYESLSLADVYNNRGRLFNIMKTYDLSFQYLEKSIRIYEKYINSSKAALNNLSIAYLNLSIAYTETNRVRDAIDILNKNLQLINQFHLESIYLTYLNLAKAYYKLSDYNKAEDYYHKSIQSLISEKGTTYFRLAEIYYDYGILLRKEEKYKEAISSHKNALLICLKNYHTKHPLVSLSYKHLGDDFISAGKVDSALFYYQRSLTAVIKDFNNNDILSNPQTDTSLFDLRLLDNLKSKANALSLLKTTDKAEQIKILNAANQAIMMALNLIDRIRNDYMSEESRIYLSQNEKETYIFAVEIASKLYSLTNEADSEKKIYSIAQRAKAAILRNELTGNELLNSSFVPDSLREKRRSVISNIAAYNNLITEEEKKASPDSARISLWKDAVFDMNRAKEKINTSISEIFPQYNDLLKKTQPSPVEDIQHKLKKGETVIDYLLSNSYKDGKRHMFIFLISHNDLKITDNYVDSTFTENAAVLRNTSDPAASGGKEADYITYTSALGYMYNSLIKPVESWFNGTILEIIPDEEIAWLPFDAFLKTAPQAGKTDYEGLDYLVRHYTFSYGYSSSLVASNSSWSLLNSTVCSFSPDYDIVSSNISSLAALKRSGEEINSIYRYFRGKRFQGGEATKAAFLGAVKRPAIFHLAMHSLSDTADSRYSYLLFEHQQSPENERLYNYEISLTTIKSPMVVLSACNSGSGTLYSGEGLMSLARGFILAGASSVIKTAWDINDETSSSVMTRFYYHLGRGDMKNVAMRKAKLDYLKSTSPATAAPFYWAAYEVQGDNSPVARNRVPVAVYSLLIIVTVVLLYLRRRNILRARS